MIKTVVTPNRLHEQHTLQARSPGGSVRTHEYQTLLTPSGEAAYDRAARLAANRNRRLRARKIMVKLLPVTEMPPASAPVVAEVQTSRKRMRICLPGACGRA